MDKSRLQFYSDGVFVIAATLLVLNLSVPVVKGLNAELALRLASMWPQFLIYVLSFGVIGNIWRVHNALLNPARTIDHTTIMINLALLAMTAFIPFVTAVAGTYPTLPAAAVLYCSTLLLVIILGYALAVQLRRIGAYGITAPAAIDASIRRLRVAFVIRLAGLVAAFFFPIVSYVLYWVVLVYYAIVSDIDQSLESYEHQEAL